MIIQKNTCTKPRFAIPFYLVILMKTYIHLTLDNTQKYPPHCHDYWEILYYIQGEGYLYTPDKNFVFSPGTIIIVPPGVLHGSVSKNIFKNICIGGDFEHFFSFDETHCIPRGNEEARTLAAMIYNNRSYEDSYLSSLCQSYCYCLLKNIHHQSRLAAVINQIVMDITDNALDPDFDLSNTISRQNYAKDYIRNEFKAATGKTPTEFLIGIRMQHAAALLNIYQHSISISEIAEKCGYNDPIYFSRLFKRYTGKSPRQFRDDLKEF